MGKKCDLDKFYTKPEIAKNLLTHLNLDGYNLIIEPSAGNGAFSNNINNINNIKNNLIALDIEPENDSIIKYDWFRYEISSEHERVLIVGNPPFGNRNNLSKKFISHALSFPNVFTIAFILPNVFKKHTNQKIFPSEWRLAKIVNIKDNGFLFEGQEYNVPCSFFIWTKDPGINDFSFDFEKYQSHPDFSIVKNKDKNNADFFVLGASPKNIININDVKSTNRGYYIKSNIELNTLIRNFQNIDWFNNGNSSANGGVSWFSIPELIKVYEDNKKL